MTNEHGEQGQHDKSSGILIPQSIPEAIQILLIIALIELLRPFAHAADKIEPELNKLEEEGRQLGYRAALYWRVIFGD